METLKDEDKQIRILVVDDALTAFIQVLEHRHVELQGFRRLEALVAGLAGDHELEVAVGPLLPDHLAHSAPDSVYII